MSTVRDVTRELMRRLDLTTVFGNPGTTEIGFLRDWPSDFRYVLGLQESAVVAMADAYAQVRRSPVLVNLHSAGGVGHGLGHVFTAYRHRTPMIVLAGQQVRSLLQPGEAFLAADDAAQFPRPYVKWSCEPARAADVPAAIARAYHVSTSAPYGPTFVSVPADDWDEAAAPVAVRPRIAGFAPDPDALGGLVDALTAARRPALVAGPAVDVDGAVPDLVELAEKCRAAVWASPMSPRSSFPEDHPLFQGFLHPEERALADALSGYDLVVVLGAPVFTYHVFRGSSSVPLPPLYLISEDEQLLARAATGVGIRATLRLAIRALTAALPPSDRVPPAPLARPPRPAARSPIPVDLVLATLADELPADAIVVEEIPSHLNVRRSHLPIRARGTGLLSTPSGTLGYALPAAIGAALGRPDRRVVAVVGDGSAMYGIQALWTAAQENAPAVFVILDNSQYAAVRILAESAGGAKVPGVDLGGIDFTALATGLGCATHLIDHPRDLRPTLTKALTDDRPTVLHIKIDPDPHTLY
ncbi:MAG TPA: benzoylformate decarboxylase [Actinophytocola sp.]|uniref:benzoylformate decarboxylase n=1 Tax=Actinophytocola sp. TaxID=1872138 RepID=UPI002DDD2778|nr:benzoylformate decarboxylase [Actinophytocola sp.]HEV2784476.1 benzoylformate decarboxylase [Actinophytocola sp.]